MYLQLKAVVHTIFMLAAAFCEQHYGSAHQGAMHMQYRE